MLMQRAVPSHGTDKTAMLKLPLCIQSMNTAKGFAVHPDERLAFDEVIIPVRVSASNTLCYTV